MTGPNGFCPQCGKARTGERFCANCGNDFWRTAHGSEVAGPSRSGGSEVPAPSMPAPATSARTWHWTATSIGLIAAGVGLIVAPFLPFITATAAFVGSLSRTGIEMVGPEAFLLCVMGGLLAAVGVQRASGTAVGRWLPIIASLIAGALTLWYYSQIDQRVQDVTGEYAIASIGTGLWLAVGASVVGLLLALRRPTARWS